MVSGEAMTDVTMSHGHLLTRDHMPIISPVSKSYHATRPVTGPSRRHMTFGWGVCRRQTGTAEFKLP